MGVDINWGALQPAPNAFGLFLQGQQQGDELRAQQAKKNAFAKYSTDPQGAVSDLMAVDPASAIQLRGVVRQDQQDAGYQKAADQFSRGDAIGAQTTAMSTRNPELAASIASLSKEQRALVREQSQQVAAALYPLQKLPPEQRAAQWQTSAQQLAAQGIPKAALNIDVTDDNAIAGHINDAMDLKTLIDTGFKDRKQTEDERHNKATEAAAGIKTVAPGGSVVDVGPGAPPATPAAAQPMKLAELVTGNFPGAKITSTTRSPAQNAAADGVANSEHLIPDHAVDFTLGSEAEMQAAAAHINASGQGLRAIYEGPGAAHSTGPHVHVQRTDAPAAEGSPGVRTLYKAPGAEKSTWTSDGQGNLINSNGDRKIDPTYNGAANANPNMVKMVLEGRYPPPTGRAATSPQWLAVLDAASAQDPNFNAADYHTRYATRKDFTSGKAAQNITALNTALGHIGDLDGQIDKLNNTGVPLLNQVGNAVANATGDPRVQQFNTTKKAVVSELVRVFRQAGGSETDMKDFEAPLNAANSPAQLHAVTAEMAKLLGSRLDALSQQYKQGLGQDKNGIELLSPKAQGVYSKLLGASGGKATVSSSDAALLAKYGVR